MTTNPDVMTFQQVKDTHPFPWVRTISSGPNGAQITLIDANHRVVQMFVMLRLVDLITRAQGPT